MGLNAACTHSMLNSKAWLKSYALLQVGDTDTDHARWCRSETDCLRLEGPYRPTWPVNITWKGSDIVGEAAATLAAVSYMIKQDEPVSALAESMLTHAKQLYAFGKAMNASWLLPAGKGDYPYRYGIADYTDDMLWAAGWLCKATADQKYCNGKKLHLK